MAPEVFRNGMSKASPRIMGLTPDLYSVGYGVAVDVWAIGVFAYYLISGIIPFERESQQLYIDAISNADYKFVPNDIWGRVSDAAKDFIGECLIIDPTNRPTAAVALRHQARASRISHMNIFG